MTIEPAMSSTTRSMPEGEVSRYPTTAQPSEHEWDGESVWATVVINPDSMEPTEITDVTFLEELSETGLSLERMFIRPGTEQRGEVERLRQVLREISDVTHGPGGTRNKGRILASVQEMARVVLETENRGGADGPS
jgi:hypothetical protein